MADHRHKIPKKDQAKHFPNWDHGGKGDRRRTSGLLNNNSPAYQDGWERIFGGKTDGED
jgi:hypothetical protein